MKAFISIVLLIAICVYVVNYHSAVESNYRCLGSFANSLSEDQVNLRIEKYRPWVGLWSDSDGAVCVEIPNEWVDFYSNSEDLTTQIQFFNFSGEIQGNFSSISNNLKASTIHGVFEGQCSRVDD